METGKELVKKETPPSFIEKLMLNSESLEQIKDVGMVIIKSGFCPDHFKASNDAVGIVMCIEAGRQLGLTWMQSLSDLYPVKGRIGMMGSAARSLIFSSGVLDKWEELTEGNYPDDNYKHIIISKRKGLPGEFRSEFSVHDAKKAGLFNKDIYQRYGKRMLMWRNIGFHATDYYGDIMKGMKTVEELNDFDVIPGVGDTTIEKEDGTKIKIKGGAKGKSEKMTDSVVDKIPDNKFEPIPDAVVVEKSDQEKLASKGEAIVKEIENQESPFIPSKGSVEFLDGKEIKREENPEKKETIPSQLTLDVMEKMDTKELLKIINADTDMIEAMAMIPGKNTNKKVREIIFAHQNNQLSEYVAKNLPQKNEGDAPGSNDQGEVHDITEPNKAFDQQGPLKEKKGELFPGELSGSNKYHLEIPEFDKGNQRDFSTMKQLFNALASVNPPINNPNYLELGRKLGITGKYPSREDFCKFATVEEINELLNAN